MERHDEIVWSTDNGRQLAKYSQGRPVCTITAFEVSYDDLLELQEVIRDLVEAMRNRL